MRARAFLLGTAMLVLHGASQAQQLASSCRTSVSLVPGGASIPLKSTAASVATLDSAALSSIAGRTLSDALTARIPGVSVMRSSGVAGTGSRISIRGPGGLITPQRPLVFIDGIRVDDEFQALLVASDSQAPSRLDDIPLDAVSCVQVLRGPAAAAAYGTDAAGGVILVTTRAPSISQSDPIRVSAFSDLGNATDGTAYPRNFARTGTPPQVSSWDPLRTYTPFRAGRLASVGGSISATPGHNFAALIRGSTQAQDGSLADNTLHRHTAGAALTLNPTPNLSLGSRAWLIHSDVRLPAGWTLLASTLLNGVPLSRTLLIPAEAQSAHVDQSSARLGGGIDAEWKPARWLVARAALGREDSRFSDIDTSPLFQLQPTTNEPVRSDFVSRRTGAARTQRTSGTTSISAAYGPDGLRSTSTLALAYSIDVRRSETHFESHSVRDTVNRSSSNSWRAYGTGDTRAITVRQTLAWDDRRFLELGARRDDIRKFLRVKNPTYPFVGATWHLSKEPFFSGFKSLSTLRLRAAYGEAGDRRDYDSGRLLGFAFVNVPGSSGDSIRPVLRSRELESGLDVGLFDNQLGIEATWYRKRVSDAPNVVPGPSANGFTVELANNGAWLTEGVELSARVQVIKTQAVQANISVAFNALRNKFLTECLCFPSGLSGPVTGHPLTSSWAPPLHFADKNSNGVIDVTEVTLDSGVRYVGSATPTRELGVAPSVTIAHQLSIAAVLDYRGGFVQYDETEAFRCRYGICAGLFDPSAPMQDQARAVLPASLGLWFDRGDFVRFRELNVTWSLPSSFAHRLGAHGASLGVAGRNLATWTKYPGLDPEVSKAGQTSFIQRDSFTVPLARTFSMRLDMRW
jgi:TonB-dependent starch-binding outer membrane protein SusC